jgi:hypothetical protein
MAIFTLPIARVGDDNFRVGSGYKLHFYAAGTTTDKDTYTDNTYATPLANPVVADGNGRFSVIWTSGDYKVVLKTDADVTVWTVDNYSTTTDSSSFAEGVLSSAGSAADVITAALTDAPGSLVDQQQVVVELQHGANTIGNPTFNLNSLGAKVIQRDNTKPLRAGDTGGNGYKMYLSYSSTHDVWVLLNPAKPVLGMGLEWKTGLKVSNGTDADHDLNIAVGQILDDTEVAILDLKSAFVKQIDATFAVGSAAGGMSDQDSSGVVQASTKYGLFMIGKVDGTVDFIYATTQANALADTVAAGASFVYARLIGYAITDSSSNILPFVHDGGDDYLWDVPPALVSTSSTSRASVALQCPPFQPCILSSTADRPAAGGSSLQVLLTSLSQTDTAPSTTVYTMQVEPDGSNAHRDTVLTTIKTDGSSQIGVRMSTVAASTAVETIARGWRMDYNITDMV